jgi:AcrR family transcriptional regulator
MSAMECSEKSCSEKRKAIIQATLELVTEHGFHGAPMAMVAERAGVAAGTIYRFFESKEVLIDAAYKEVEDRLLKKVLEDYPEQGTPREKFTHLARVLVEQWLAYPVEFTFLQQFHNSPYGVAVRREKLQGHAQDVCHSVFAEALEQQAVKDLPIPVLFALAIGPLIYICRDHGLGFFDADNGLLQQAIESCWSAVKR